MTFLLPLHHKAWLLVALFSCPEKIHWDMSLFFVLFALESASKWGTLFLLHHKMAAETFCSEFWLLACMDLGSGRTDIPDVPPNVLLRKYWLKSLWAEQPLVEVCQGDFIQRTTEVERMVLITEISGWGCGKVKPGLGISEWKGNSFRRWANFMLEYRQREGRWEDRKQNWRWKKWTHPDPFVESLKSESK